MISRHLTSISCQRRCWDDWFILAEVRAFPHIVFEGALGFVAVQGGGVVFRLKAVVWRYPLQAAEWRLAAPWLGQSITALKALNALKGVLATELTWEEQTSGHGKREKSKCYKAATVVLYILKQIPNNKVLKPLIKVQFFECTDA